jgi:CD2 antigen cytoplasmic tail-binding protein 2
MASTARPKRQGDLHARTHIPTTSSVNPDNPDNNTLHFDVRNPSALAPEAAEEDAILELDEIGKSSAVGVKRNAVNLDGYESDSSNEGFDARAEAKAKKQKASEKKTKDEEDADMFADLEEPDGDDDEDSVGKKKKSVKFLEEKQIEGQINSSKSGGKVKADFAATSSFDLGKDGKRRARRNSDSSSSSSSASEAEEEAQEPEPDAEVGLGGMKKNAPKLDAFNMKSELEDGGFDDQGNYVRRAMDPDAQHDTWLDGVSKKDVKKAREAAEKREMAERREEIAIDGVLTRDALREIIVLLDKGETVLEAQARYGKIRGAIKKEKKLPKWKQKKLHAKEDEMELDAASEKEKRDKDDATKAIETLSSYASILLSRAFTNVYDCEREVLTRIWSKETDEPWVEPKEVPELVHTTANAQGNKETKWEYRWKTADGSGDIYGPFGAQDMEAWDAAGFFSEDNAEFRSSTNESWIGRSEISSW